MKRNFFKTCFNLISAVMLSLCLVFPSSITTYAKTNVAQLASSQTQKIDIEKVLLEKQQKIDKYVFEEHAKEIEQKGFKVTHTGPMKDYVEIGITPFNKENADYLYNIFGKDKVKIVEGQQAILMNDSVSTTAAENKNISEKATTNPLIYGLAGAAVMGAISFILIKRK